MIRYIDFESIKFTMQIKHTTGVENHSHKIERSLKNVMCDNFYRPLVDETYTRKRCLVYLHFAKVVVGRRHCSSTDGFFDAFNATLR
jgi:hypothetical protein